jgi:uncharacterized protein YndB with AHSA1/START domain
MSKHSVAHDTFTIERSFPVPPAKLYAAFATKEGKERWFTGPGEWELLKREFDFRDGGHEHTSGKFPSGMVTQFDATYFDIVPNERIVYSYTMHINGNKISVSLATLEISADGSGSKLIMTEQGAFLDGYDDSGSRERGTRDLLEKVAKSLA